MKSFQKKTFKSIQLLKQLLKWAYGIILAGHLVTHKKSRLKRDGHFLFNFAKT